jgi:hypothetical protein
MRSCLASVAAMEMIASRKMPQLSKYGTCNGRGVLPQVSQCRPSRPSFGDRRQSRVDVASASSGWRASSRRRGLMSGIAHGSRSEPAAALPIALVILSTQF